MANTTLSTSDTDFASAMMAKGGHLVSWEPSSDGGRSRMIWTLEKVNHEWVEAYRRGLDGFAAFIHARRMLVNIVKTDDRIENK